jgi:hypothetical protein
MMHKMISPALLFLPPLQAYFFLKETAPALSVGKEGALSERTATMHTDIQAEKQLAKETQVQATIMETELLAQCGFSTEEIVSLLWLRQWYQTGGSDRVQIVRHLEFLRLLVLNGKMEA